MKLYLLLCLTFSKIFGMTSELEAIDELRKKNNLLRELNNLLRERNNLFIKLNSIWESKIMNIKKNNILEKKRMLY